MSLNKRSNKSPLWLLGTLIVSIPLTPSATAAGNWQCKATPTGEWECANVSADQVSSSETRAGQSFSQQAIINTPLSRGPVFHPMDWVNNPVDQPGNVCRGYYAEPALAPIPESSDPEQPVYLEAGRSSTELGSVSSLSNGVSLRHLNKQLSARSATLDQRNNTAVFLQQVEYREPGVLLVSDNATLEMDSEQSEFNYAQFVLHREHLRGMAERIYRDATTEQLILDEGHYTFCPPGSNDWTLHSDRITLDQIEGVGTAEDAVLRIGPVPILYAPYLSFPIDDRRRSGFLYPSFSYTNNNGLDIALPYYINLAPNYDDTLTPRSISKRGLMLENEFRYLGQKQNARISAAYLPDDELFGDDRWLGALTHHATLAPGLTTSVDLTAVSDNDYFDDLTTDLEISRQSHLDKKAELVYREADWSVTTRVHTYQTIDSSLAPYRRLPQVLFTSEKIYESVELNQLAEIVSFDRDIDGLTGANRITGSRMHYHPTLSMPMRQAWGFFEPQAEAWLTQYTLQNQLSGLDESPGYAIPVLSFDSGLVFERDLSSGGIQTLEPRLFGLYVKDEDQSEAPDFDTALRDFNYNNLFQSNRFSGRDRIGDAQQLSLGITTRLYEETGFEWFNFSIGQAYYFDDRDVTVDSGAVETDGQSDVAQLANWYLNSKWRLTLENIFAHENLKAEKSNFRVRYTGDLNHRLEFSYRFEDNVRNQFDTSAIWPINHSWTAMGRWQYDLEDSENIDTALGLEYESCCWAVRFTARRWLTDASEYDNGIFLRFLLKGLGSLRSSNDDFLNDIYGFEERDNQDPF